MAAPKRPSTSHEARRARKRRRAGERELTVRMDAASYRELEEAARESDRSISAYVRVAVRAAIQADRRRADGRDEKGATA